MRTIEERNRSKHICIITTYIFFLKRNIAMCIKINVTLPNWSKRYMNICTFLVWRSSFCWRVFFFKLKTKFIDKINTENHLTKMYITQKSKQIVSHMWNSIKTKQNTLYFQFSYVSQPGTSILPSYNQEYTPLSAHIFPCVPIFQQSCTTRAGRETPILILISMLRIYQSLFVALNFNTSRARCWYFYLKRHTGKASMVSGDLFDWGSHFESDLSSTMK